ncbi:trypsin CFT-1-like [Aricia agestis]|uniref:trypsin CFT-1-like n=1 Tax=Aricia agestis TaxID=91739 RepID=UPI001C2045EE|nr:trypsin CFT-1-like [Aricia agestis]XP_041976893.1 trypsin CFT-1-like [Aricia agestis]
MRTLVFLAALGVATAAPQLHTSRIVGGSDTDVETYPFMSNMQRSWFLIWWFQSCGGTLITRTSVLSAAHCYYGDSSSEWRVVLGTSLASGTDSIHYVSKLIVHKDYDPNLLVNDVAIVKLETPASLSNRINVASIAGPHFHLPDDTQVTAIGWGTLSSGGASVEQLQHVDLNIINQKICAERYAKLKETPGYEGWPNITPGMICLGILDIGGKDACQGDSGGPVVYNRSISIGITSWGYGCAHSHYPGVNTRVSSYTDWIVTNAK